MSYGIDFGALRPPNAFDSAMQGFEAGREHRRERDTTNAFALYANDPEAGYKAMMAVDPKTGIALREDASQRAATTRRQQIASQHAGDFRGGQEAALAAGDFDLAGEFGKLSKEQREQAKESAELLAAIGTGLKSKPYEQRKPILEAAKPHLVQRGLKPEMIDTFDPTDANLDGVIFQAVDLKTQMEMQAPDIRQSGRFVEARDKLTGEKRWASTLPRDPEVKAFGRDQEVYEVGGDGGTSAPQRPAGDTDSLFEALIQQESGGRAGVTGPQTDYGRAEGMTQMLPETAQSMAQKLGVPWRPELMRGTSPEAADYQRQLGRAYFEEGLEKYGGDPEKALMYYHGGPDESIWGPKTRRYAQEVLARVEPYEVAANGVTPPPQGGGMRLVRPAAPKQEDAPSGYRWAADGATLEPIPGGPARGAGPLKLTPQDSKFISEARTAANQAQEMARKGNRFIQLNKKMATGPIRAGVLGSVSKLDPDVNEMASIVDNLVPAMRQGLPGAASDRDVAMFRNATVGIDKYGTVNQNIVTAINAGARRQQQYVAFLEDYAKQNGNLLGAQEEWDAYAAASPLFEEGKDGQLALLKQTSWRDYFGRAEAPRAAPQRPAQPRQAQGRAPQARQRQAAPVRVRTVQEAQALAPGTEFIDPNGVKRRR